MCVVILVFNFAPLSSFLVSLEFRCEDRILKIQLSCNEAQPIWQLFVSSLCQFFSIINYTPLLDPFNECSVDVKSTETRSYISG
ncbi:hypothetical protein M758_8G179600 [Ceratodon purpureus]|uniref:Secreted protein n=1 Tax=Ceratodon purpureus TaxID=3225 RepID=A0A8T0H4U1_CERPU|nr:hypothetical protein KC19_8G184500 [Ceratodon purpureus]KAG0609375.1 hypothetical protein M758_8G179600 [Ceratodon purpureus]